MTFTPTPPTVFQAIPPAPHPSSFGVHIEQRPVYRTTEYVFNIQEGQHRITMEGTKANWRWIQARAKAQNMECEMPQEVFDSLPETGDVTYTTLAHFPHAP